MVLLIKLAILFGVCGVPVLLALACKALERWSARSSDSQWFERGTLLIYGFVGLWHVYGLWAVFVAKKLSPLPFVLGLSGILFACFFFLSCMTLDWLESRPKARARVSWKRLSRKDTLWDAELDH